ncbi:30S ribosomal protein S4 [Patescibacteria group bacterium]|nr:30S ribosomal protein S4 [Patescibacteria group bacterium]
MQNKKCRICRRLGAKLFLKGEKCLSPKCPMVKRPYPPGQKRKRRLRTLSEYGKELREKQKLKNWYNLEERQFKRYVEQALESRGKAEDNVTFLIKKLESRLDNVIFRLGFASSRAQARQLVNHGHFSIDGKAVDIPSYQLKKGNKITLHPTSREKNIFQNLQTKLKKYQPPSWLSLDIKTLTGEVIASPSLEEVAPPAEIPIIFEFYSR